MRQISRGARPLTLSNNYTFVFVSLLCYLITAFILAVVPPASGYEYSVYTSYPPLLWILVIFLFVLPLLYIFLSVRGYFGLNYQKWTIRWLVIVSFMTLILMLYMPLIRGDPIHYSGDTLYHLGVIYDLLRDGYLQANHYPYVHVLGTIFTLILGVARTVVSHNLIPIFSTLFVLGIFCCARSVHLPHYSVMAITALSIIPVIPWITIEGIMPSTIGLQLLPLFIFLTYNTLSKNSSNIRYLGLTVLLIIILVFVHPEITIYSVAFLGIAMMVEGVYSYINKEKPPISFYWLIGLFLLSVIVFLCFMSTTSVLSGTITHYINIIHEILFSGDSAQEPVVKIAESTTPFIPRLIGFIGEIAGYLIILSLTCVTVLYGLKQKLLKYPVYVLITVTFIVYCLISASAMFLYFEMFGFTRLLKYPMLIALFLCGFTFADLLSERNTIKFKKILSIMFVIAIVTTATFSVFTLYGNPYLNSNNKHTTHQDVSGMELFYTYSDKDTLVVENSFREHQERYMKYLYGASATMKNIRGTFNSAIIVPAHLGYDTHKYFADVYNKIYYLKYPPFKEYIPLFTSVPKYPADITVTDYNHLDYDKSADLIQTGGDLEVYITSPHT